MKLKKALRSIGLIIAFPVIVILFLLGWTMISEEDRAYWKKRFEHEKRTS